MADGADGGHQISHWFVLVGLNKDVFGQNKPNFTLSEIIAMLFPCMLLGEENLFCTLHREMMTLLNTITYNAKNADVLAPY